MSGLQTKRKRERPAAAHLPEAGFVGAGSVVRVPDEVVLDDRHGGVHDHERRAALHPNAPQCTPMHPPPRLSCLTELQGVG